MNDAGRRRDARLLIGVLAGGLALVAAIVAATAMRTPSPVPASVVSPSPSVTVSATEHVTATSSPASTPARSPGGTPPATPTAAAGVKPDSLHGVIVATGNMRTEDDPRGLQEPTLFMTNSGYAVSPDGKQIALIRTAQTGQQVVAFTTVRPNDITIVLGLEGSGERATNVVWAGDGSESMLVAVVKEVLPSGGGDVRYEYSALRAVDMRDRSVREIARISGQSTRLWPVAWLPARQIAAAAELGPRGPAVSYVTVRAGTVERAAITPNPNVLWFSASRDGQRIVLSLQTSIRWRPTDRPSAVKGSAAQAGETFGHAEFRPGADELGVDVGSSFEIWTLAGQRRVVAARTPGFLRWRVDGTAAIASSDPFAVWLIDPATGAKMQLPGGGFPLADVVMF